MEGVLFYLQSGMKELNLYWDPGEKSHKGCGYYYPPPQLSLACRLESVSLLAFMRTERMDDRREIWVNSQEGIIHGPHFCSLSIVNEKGLWLE
jgi:hypothetical protein